MRSNHTAPTLSRRSVALGAAALLLHCRRGDAGADRFDPPERAAFARALGPPPPAAGSVAGGSSASPAAVDAGVVGATRLLAWEFPGAVSTRTTVLVPATPPAGARYPVLVALHGRGEAQRSPADGALGWPRDYALARAYQRVSAPPLTVGDFEGFVSVARLGALNALLARRAFGGLVVACPYVPDLDTRDETAVAAFGGFVRETLLPRVRRETPALADKVATGIDGVSLGGLLSLRIGLASPAAFGAVGALQAALDERDATLWTERALAARRLNPALKLRLLTSDGDYFLEPNRAVSRAWSDAGITHDFELGLGPHDYPFNRGPGSIEMLVWHDRSLR